MNIEILKATPGESEIVSNLVFELLTILVGHKRNIDSKKLSETSNMLLQPGTGFHSYIARYEEEPVGVITISKSAAIYAGGFYGVIEELYVKDSYRSQSVGKKLLKKAVELAESEKWPRLEVSTPEGEQWKRTVEFYKREGFTGNSSGERLKIKI